MNRATPIVLLALLVLAGTYVVFFEIRPRTRLLVEDERAKRRARVFDVERTDAVANSVREFRIEREGAPIVFERVAERVWRITEPVKSLARSSVVGALVRDVLFLDKVGDDIPKEGRPADGLAAWGLDKPRIVVRLKLGTGDQKKELALHLGNVEPTNPYVYAQHPGAESVVVLEKQIVERLAKSVHDYRETKFLRFARNQVREFRLRSTRTRVELKKEGETWMVTRPYRDRADSLRVEDAMRAVEDIEAESFYAESAGNLKPLGLDRAPIEVSFVRDDNSTDTVLIGTAAKDPVGTVYAKLADEPTIYTTKDDVVGKLTFLAEFLRDRKFAWVSSANVKAFRIEGAGPKVVLLKADDKWKIAEPVKIDAEPDEVDSFIRALAALNVFRFPNDAPDDAALKRYGLDQKSRVALTVGLTDKPDQVYYIGRIDPKQKDLYVQRQGSDSVYTVKETFRKSVTGTYLDFRKRQVAEMSRYDMKKFDVKRPEGDFSLAKAPDDKWRMTAPVNAPGDDLAVGDLLNDLENLKAVKFLAEKAEKLADYGLDKPACEVTIELKEDKDKPAKTRVLSIGKAMGDDGYAAKLKSDDVIFTVSNTLAERLRQEFRKRTVWEIKRGGVSALVWQSTSEKVSTRLEEGAWKLLEPAGRKLDEMRVEDVLNNFNYLRVNRFEAYTKDNLAQYGLDKPRLKITITVENTPRTMSVGKPKDKDNVYVMVSDADAVFTLSTATVKTLTDSLLVPPEKPEEKKTEEKTAK